jgi:hypothetical protein
VRAGSACRRGEEEAEGVWRERREGERTEVRDGHS